jgi:hypothetical protein
MPIAIGGPYALPRPSGSGISNIVASTGTSVNTSGGTGVGRASTFVGSIPFTYTPSPLSVWAQRVHRELGRALSIDDTLGNVISATFSTSFTTPVVGMQINLDFGAGDIFVGVLLTVETTKKGDSDELFYLITAGDFEYMFNRRRPIKAFYNISATAIATTLVGSFTNGFTTTGIQAGLPKITIEFDGSKSLSQCFEDIALAINGSYRLDNRNVRLYMYDTEEAPDELNDTNHNLLREPNLQWTEDTRQLRNRVFVKGSGTTVAANVATGATTIPLTDVNLLPGSGTAYVAGQLVNYSGFFGARVIENTDTYPKPTIPPTTSNGGGGGSFPAGNYWVAYSAVYPDGHETTVSPRTLVTLDGTHLLQLSNLQVFGVPRRVYISREADNMDPGTVGDLGLIDSTSGSASLVVTPFSAGTGSFEIDFNPDDGSTLSVPVPTTGERTVHFLTYNIFLNGAFNTPYSINTLPGNGFRVVIDTTDADPSGNRTSASISHSDSGFDPNVILTVESTPYPGGQHFYDQDFNRPTIFSLVTELFTHRVKVVNNAGSAIDPYLVFNWQGRILHGKFALDGWTARLPTASSVGPLKVSDPTRFDPVGKVDVGSQTLPYHKVDDKLVLDEDPACPIRASSADCPDPGDGGGGGGGGGFDGGDAIIPSNNGCETMGDDACDTGSGFGGDGAGATGGNGPTKSNGSLLLTSPTTGPIPMNSAINFWVQRDDVAAQVSAAAREGEGDGIHEGPVISDDNILTIRQAEIRGDGELALFSMPIRTVSYATRDPKTASGKTVSINLTNPPLVGLFKIQTVNIDEIHMDMVESLPPVYAVSASSVRFTLADFLRRLAKQ